MELRGEATVRENVTSAEISFGLLRIQATIEKDGRWAIGVVQHSDPGLVCRVQGKDGKVLSTEFPEAEAEIRKGLERLKLTQ
jgi:hypothetical protein